MSSSKSDRILVTGAAGLMGSALVEHLREEGFENVIPFTRAEADLIDTAATHAAFERLRPDHVFHSAARVYGILGSLKNQGMLFHENAMMNANVVEASRRAGVGKITVMGTGAVYPFPAPALPLKEDMILTGRPHPAQAGYANAKLAMLMMLEAYQESYGMKWAYIVSANLFGPRDRFDTETGNVVPSLIRKFHAAKTSGGKVVVWGDGSAERDFVYIKDAARIARGVMESIEGPVNMGSGQVRRIRDIVDILADITGLGDRIEWDRSKPNGQAYRGYDLTKIEAIGLKPAFSIREGLKETWDWYCANHD
jgi:GDP-L-fucose synthase